MHNEINVLNGTVTIPTSDTVLAGTNSHVMAGLVRWVGFTTANMQDTDSTLFTILETGKAVNGTMFTTGTVAESTSFNYGTIFPVHGTVEVRMTAEGTQAAARAIPYTVLYEPYN